MNKFDNELPIRNRIVNCFNGDVLVPSSAISNVERLIDKLILEGKLSSLQALRIRFSTYTWGNYNPFDLIDEEIKAIEIELQKGNHE